MKFQKRLIMLLVTLILVALLFSQVKISEVIRTLISLPFIIVVVGFFLYLTGIFFRSLRFYILLRKKVILKNLFSIVCVHNMSNNLLPARTGELSYIYLLKKRGIAVTEGIGTLLIARFFDFVIISIIFLLSLLFIESAPTEITRLIKFIIIVLFILVITFIFFIFSKFKLPKGKILGKINEIIQTTRTIDPAKMFYLFVISLLIWTPLYLMIYLFMLGFSIDLSFFAVMVGATFPVIVALAPIPSIAGFGPMEAGWAIAFVLLGMNKSAAISTGFAVHILQFIYFVILGLYGLNTLSSAEKNHDGEQTKKRGSGK